MNNDFSSILYLPFLFFCLIGGLVYIVLDKKRREAEAQRRQENLRKQQIFRRLSPSIELLGEALYGLLADKSKWFNPKGSAGLNNKQLSQLELDMQKTLRTCQAYLSSSDENLLTRENLPIGKYLAPRTKGGLTTLSRVMSASFDSGILQRQATRVETAYEALEEEFGYSRR